MTPAPATAAKLRAFADDFTDQPCPGRLFLDTNVVLAIQQHEMAMAPPPNAPRPYGRMNQPLADFLRRARRTGAELIVTPAVVEEVFHVSLMKSAKRGSGTAPRSKS